MDFFWSGGQAYTHNGDWDLMRSLGLKTNFNRDWTDLGTVTLEEASDDEYGHKPATTIKVEASAMPAQFWRFTITRPREEIRELAEGEDHPFARPGDPRWVSVREPVEQFVMTTGSGGFGGYWETAKAVAQNMVNVERVS